MAKKEDQEIVKHISDTLDEVLVVLKRPKNLFLRIFEIGAMVISVLAIIGIIDIILKWIKGG